MRPTIRDVALYAGVSIKTVSRVLNDEPYVREDTRAKVLAAINELGFVANLSAKRLAKGQAFTIGLLFHNASWHYIMDAQRGVLDTARVFGYSTLMHPCDMERPLDASEILAQATQRQVDGFIFTPPADNAIGLLESLDAMGVPFVRLTPWDRTRDWPYVAATDRAGAREMTEYLLGLGHRRIGYVRGPQDQKAGVDRHEGYRDALAAAGLDYDPDLVRQGDDQFETGRVAARSLLEMASRPTAIFCNNDEMAAGTCVGAREAGLRVPDDVSVAGFDDIPLAQQVWPPLTTVCQPIYDLAAAATRMLIGLLNLESPPRLVEIPTRLLARASTAPLLRQPRHIKDSLP
jgi:LacI family transcriptional regulator